MRARCQGPGVQVVAAVPVAGPGAAADHHGDAGVQRLLDLLRADEVDVAVDAAGGEDLALAGDRLRSRADDDVDARLDVRVAGLADCRDAPLAQADIGLEDAGVVDDQRIGYDGVDGAVGARDLALTHAVADHLATAELHLLAVGGEVLLHLDDEIGIGEPHLVAGGRPEHVGIGGTRDTGRHVASASFSSFVSIACCADLWRERLQLWLRRPSLLLESPGMSAP